MNTVLLSAAAQQIEVSGQTGYIAGAVIALFILIYLVYSMIKPEKF